MKKLITIVILILTANAQASYITPSLNQLILKADQILYGEIICVDDAVIEVSVCESVYSSLKTITITKFKEWNCGKRWMEYEVGDTSLFFLTCRNGRYQAMGGGNEGELPIHSANIYVHASSLSSIEFLDQFERSDIPMKNNGYNNPYNGYVMDLVDFWNATITVKKCFTSEVDAIGRLVNIEQLCAYTDFQSILEDNKILHWVLSELKS